MSSPPHDGPLQWAPDTLDGFEAAALGDATLVRRAGSDAPHPRAVVLHVHGYNDYFFQAHLADAVEAAGHAFYALDTPRAGRSLRAGDTPHYMTDVRQPARSLDAAMDVIDREHPGVPVVVHAHSTGGLVATLWAARSAPANLALLVLNSPFFGLHMTRARLALTRVVVPVVAAFSPMTVLSAKPSVYAAHLHRSGGGEWEFDTNLKRPAGVPARAGWLRAVMKAQSRARRGLRLPVPTLVARSDATGPESADNPDMLSQDVVLFVDDIARTAARLGPNVDTLVVPGAVHELSLSAPPVREHFFTRTFEWIDRRLP